MRKLSIALGLTVVMAFVFYARAEDDGKEVSLKGEITCAKCGLMLKGVTKCATVIKVTKDDKDTIYYFEKDSDKKYHKDICKEAKKGSVKGTCKKDGEKLILTVKELKYDD